MQLSIVEPSAEQSELIGEYKRRRGVLDYILLRSDSELLSDEENHREACFHAVSEAMRRIGERPVVAIDDAIGKPVSLEQFYGWHFDVTQSRLRLLSMNVFPDRFTSGSSFGGPWSWADDTNPELAIETDGVDSGYAAGFIDPPYGLEGPSNEIQDLFVSMNSEFIPAHDSIWWWEGGEWSPYFEAGLEWSGAWVATIQTGPRSFLAICASSTD